MARTALDPKTANVLYHDAAATTYDDKWSISFDEPGRTYVRERAERMLPSKRYERVLEVGAGTGFFVLNLWQAGYVGKAQATDISERMLAVARDNAELIGCELETRVGDAESLPYQDDAFDLVVGHAFLHHVPEPLSALAEMRRILRPGGAILIAGEPTRLGDRIAGAAKVATRVSWRTAARIPGLGSIGRDRSAASSAEERALRELEFDVDLHTFDPGQVARWAEEAGFGAVRTETEELLASVFGWAVRTLESEARPGLLGRRWARFAYTWWRRLYEMDQSLYRMLPKRIFYNLLVYAEKRP